MAAPAAQSAQQRQQKRRAAKAAATVAAANVAGDAAAGSTATVAGAPIAVGVVLAGILTALAQFLAALREQHRAALTRELGRYSTSSSDITAAVAEEMRLEEEFAKNSADRVAGKMPQALAIADPQEREAAVRQILSDEERFARQRAEAMFARAIAAVTRSQLRTDSPLGAFWRLGHAQKHTNGCLQMAGRFWPWSVIDRVHPPRHYGCTSSLHGYGEAILNGWMTPSDVQDERSAIRAAAGVMMEGVAGALERELDVRDRLLEAGADAATLAAIPLKGLEEAFDEGKHPRGWGGKFRKAGDVAAVMAQRSLAWRDRAVGTGTMTRDADAPSLEQVTKNWAGHLRGRLSQDREAIGMLARAQEQNRALGLYQSIVAKHLPDHAIVTKDATDKRFSLLDGMHGRPHRVAGTTVIKDASIKEIGLDGGKTPKDHPAATSGYGLAAVLRHEYGHSIDDELPRDVRRHILDAIPNPSEDLTYYAGFGGDQEVIPELLATITQPGYRASDWPASVQEAERRLLAALGVKRNQEGGADGATASVRAAA